MAISRKELLDELASLKDLDLEKVIEKFESTDHRALFLMSNLAAGAGVGAIIAGPIGAAVGAAAAGISATLVNFDSPQEKAQEVRNAVSKKDETLFPKIFCVWVEKEKKDGTWLKFTEN